MFPFKKILCPTDFSEPSRVGLQMGAEMARQFSAEIVILNVHKPIPSLPKPHFQTSELTFDISAYEKEVAAEARNRLAELVGEVFTDIDPRLEVRMGRPAKTILAFAEEEDVDAIVIATHGRTGLAHMVFGSVAEMVVRYAKCPVLTVRS